MVSSRQDGLLQDKVTLLPGKLELLRLQFPLTTDSLPTTSSMFPILWLYSILPAHQFNWTRRAALCALPLLFKITFIITNDPSEIKETLFAFLVPGNPYCGHRPWQWRRSYIKLSHLTSVYRRFSSSNDLTHVVSNLYQEERMKPEQIAVLWPVFSPPCQDLAVAVQKM